MSMYGSASYNGAFMQPAGVVLLFFRESKGSIDQSLILFENAATAWAGANIFVWFLTDPLLSFPRRGGLNSDTLIPNDVLHDVLKQRVPRVGQSVPVGDRIQPVLPLEERHSDWHDGCLEYMSQSSVCRVVCSSDAAASMQSRTRQYPQMWPCRADFADAFVQSFSFTCTGDHSTPNRKQRSDLERMACVLAIDALFASYLVGKLNITVATESGSLVYQKLFDVGHSSDTPLHSSQLECSSRATMDRAPLVLQIYVPWMAGSNLHAMLDLVGSSMGVSGANLVQVPLNARCSVDGGCEMYHVPSALGLDGCSLAIEVINTH